MASSARVANTASVATIAKIPRSNLPKMNDEYLTSDLDHIIESYEDLLVDLLQATPRPVASTITDATKKAFDVDFQEAKLFSQRLCDSISYARGLSKRMTSGKKLAPATPRLRLSLKALHSPCDLAAKARAFEAKPVTEDMASEKSPVTREASELLVPSSCSKSLRLLVDSQSQSSAQSLLLFSPPSTTEVHLPNC